MRFALLLLAIAGASAADDIRDTGRAALEKHREAIVTVRVVAKIHVAMHGQNQDQERKFEAGGTVIDPSGLVVASTAGVDPGANLKAMVAAYADKKLQIQASCDVKETTLIMDDGAELEADIVLEDSDLDLAFIKPRDARAFAAIELKPHAPPRPLDPVFVLARLGKNVSRAAAVSLGDVIALVKGPQPYAVPCFTGLTSPGSVVFAADGEPLGVLVTKQAIPDPGGSGGAGMLGGNQNQVAPVLRPCDAVLALAAQAKQAKAPEKKDEAAADDAKPAGAAPAP